MRPPALQALWERYDTPGRAMPGVKQVVKSRLKIVFGQDGGRYQIVFKAQSGYTSFDVIRQACKSYWGVL